MLDIHVSEQIVHQLMPCNGHCSPDHETGLYNEDICILFILIFYDITHLVINSIYDQFVWYF